MINDSTELIVTVFFGWLGVHKFLERKIGIGMIYLLTFGLYGVGWIYDIYTCIYYKSKRFNSIRSSIKENTVKCNELNEHIEDLKRSYINIKRTDYGISDYGDTSRWSYKRPDINKFKDANNIINCSRSICSNARSQPFRYVCKYFNIKPNEENLEKFEKILNNFLAAEQGKTLLKHERDSIINGISHKIPFLIKYFNKNKVIEKLGFKNIDFSQLYFPKYTFRYISSGGNASMNCNIIFDIPNLEKFIHYLSSIIEFKKSIAEQRLLMTYSLREKIKSRDNYTCCLCKNSTKKEPNLLLEIDHIIPISKGGITSEKNLQTLCWKCNRSKGSKILDQKNTKN